MLRQSPRLAAPSRAASKKPRTDPVLARPTRTASTASSERPVSPTSAAMLAKEMDYWAAGHAGVVGVDEAGRGPLAGPVVTCAVMFAKGVDIPGLDDSKKLTEEERQVAFEALTKHKGVRYAVSIVGPKIIDEMNILAATMHGMDTCILDLKKQGASVDVVLVDGPFLPPKCKVDGSISAKEAIKGGDAKVRAIAAASIIAKVTRDAIMVKEAKRFPIYGFEVHKGYPVPQHREALARHGPCEIHRMSFRPCREAVAAAAAAAVSKR